MTTHNVDSRPSAVGHIPPSVSALASLPSSTGEFALAAARSEHPVLLIGETGSGKTHLARVIHEVSARRDRPLVPVNCGAIPGELFEREMFGHVRGAFTGAADSQPGLFEAADGGTLFLDEIGELPLAMQPKLLRALEDGAVRRLGSTREVTVDVRIILASNQDLGTMVEEKQFREDLYYRCCVLEHRVPPLRERRREIPALARELLARRAGRANPCEVSDAAMALICAYSWRGNIRELDNCLCQASAFVKGNTIEVFDLPDRVRHYHGESEAAPSRRGAVAAVPSPRHRYAAPESTQQERETIADALRTAKGNRTRAARALGMSRSTLWAKMKLLGID